MITFRNGRPAEQIDIPDGDYYTVAEYAERMDVPQGTVRMWIHRGLVSCKSCYGHIYISANEPVMYRQKMRNYVTARYERS